MEIQGGRQQLNRVLGVMSWTPTAVKGPSGRATSQRRSFRTTVSLQGDQVRGPSTQFPADTQQEQGLVGTKGQA